MERKTCHHELHVLSNYATSFRTALRLVSASICLLLTTLAIAQATVAVNPMLLATGLIVRLASVTAHLCIVD